MKIVFEARASTILFNLAAETFRTGARFLLPANVCPVVPLALLAAGRPFEFVDLDPESLCMDWTRLRERITARNKPSVAAVLYARTYGIEGDAGALFRELKALDDKLLLIDDRCGGRPEPDSALADPQGANVVLYSTGYGKYVDLGFGGFAHMHDEVAYRSRRGRSSTRICAKRRHCTSSTSTSLHLSIPGLGRLPVIRFGDSETGSRRRLPR